MKARIVNIDYPTWVIINPEEVKKIHLTPFGYFNIEFNDGKIFSYDKLDME